MKESLADTACALSAMIVTTTEATVARTRDSMATWKWEEEDEAVAELDDDIEDDKAPLAGSVSPPAQASRPVEAAVPQPPPPQANPWGAPPPDWNDPVQQEERRIAMENWMLQMAADTRQAIIDEGKLDERQTAQFDQVIDTMNLQVANVAQEWADYIRETGTLNADDRLRLMHDMSTTLVTASDDLDSRFPEWRNTNSDLLRLIDPAVFAPFMELRNEGFRIPGNGMFGRGGPRPNFNPNPNR
ncbi:MAG: hypothetical protein FWF84_03050 [Kiritimatiellaeota bacterium]|nr:hypothetical protein [Kiritimatiellota bacterium]